MKNSDCNAYIYISNIIKEKLYIKYRQMKINMLLKQRITVF